MMVKLLRPRDWGFRGGAAAAVFGAYVVIAFVAPWVSPHPPLELGDSPLSPPSLTHLFGTDQLGRDILSRALHGARLSLSVAFGAVALAVVAGGTLGLVSGYFGRWIDAAVGRLTDILFAVPDIVLALVLMAVLGPSLINVAVAVGIVYTPIFVRVVRGATLRVAEQEYVQAARAAGLSQARILFRHVLPNVLPPLLVQVTLCLAFAILAEAAISFLGLSGQADAPSWGLMLRQGKDYMELAWWVAVFPGLAIALLVLAMNVLGDALQQAIDPRGVAR